MIDELEATIPKDLRNLSGKVFYSGREAFSGRRDLYFLGTNPGGNPDDPWERTIQQDIDFVLRDTPPLWSAYRDESWCGMPPGQGGFQPQVLDLFRYIGIDPDKTPSSNLHFVRSRRTQNLTVRDFNAFVQKCFPFHSKIIQELKTKVVVVAGVSKADQFRKLLGCTTEVDSFTQERGQPWTSKIYQRNDGLLFVGLTHPSTAHWHFPEFDPRPMLKKWLVKLGITKE